MSGEQKVQTYRIPQENGAYVLLSIKGVLMVFVVGVIFSILTYIQKTGLDDARRTQTNVDYIRLQTEMLFSLKRHFTSDNTSSSDEISSYWNKFFIKYDCCAVREVQGTTNDFDNTPWCTTSGSCQATASQIPKTCCKDVTQDDYTRAPDGCHASVNPGTYRPSCISRVKYLTVSNIDVCQVFILSFSLLSLVTFQIFEAIVSFVMTLFSIRNQKNKTIPDERNCNTEMHTFPNNSYENTDGSSHVIEKRENLVM